jgi:hypothetical protein
MALGKRKDALNFTPLVKFDARNGKLFRCDRVQDDTGDWETKQTDITDSFSAIVDMENIEIGWIAFSSGGPPDFKMVPVGSEIGERPSDNHKEGFRVRMKLANGAGNDVRELTSTAKSNWQSLDDLHDEYLNERSKHKGKLPIVGIAEVAQVKTAAGTNYRPIFVITGWTKRPADLVNSK